MMRRSALTGIVFSLAMRGGKTHAAASDELAMRLSRNAAGRIGLVTGSAFGTYARIAADMAAVLDDGDQQRIVPQQGRGSLQNLADLLFMKGVDLAIVQADVLMRVRLERTMPNESSIQYIAKLYDEEVHILARRDIRTLRDLAGQAVNVDVTGSGTAETARALFEQLGIKIKAVNNDQLKALAQLQRNEIAALAYVAGKPTPLFAEVTARDGLHFLPVPLTARLIQDYLPSRLTSAQYPALIDERTPVDTVAVGAVLVTLASAQGPERSHRVSRLVETLFARFEQLSRPSRHPKWQEVSLRASIPKITRFPASQAQLDRSMVKKPGDVRDTFEAFLTRGGQARAEIDETRKEALFRDFMQWRDRQAVR